MFWVALALFAVSFVLQALLAPKPPALKPGVVKPPRSVEGDPIPVVFGTCKVAPNCAWLGDRKSEPIRKSSGFFGLSKTTVGYRYKAGMQAIICHGPVALLDIIFDETRYLSLLTPQPSFVTYVGQSPTYTGTPAISPSFPQLDTGSGTVRLTVNAPGLYGGSNEGGTYGPIDFYFGSDTQPANAYLASAAAQNQAVSQYKGICYAVFNQYYWSQSPFIKAVHFLVQRLPIAVMGFGNSGIAGDLNPVEIIYEILTNATWGLGQQPAAIDLASFQAAGSTLKAEGLGLSFALESDQDAASVILEVLHHIDGVLYTHPLTGLLTLSLTRDDYQRVPPDDSLVRISRANAREISIARPTTKELITEVKVSYTNRTLNFSTRTESVQNAAANQQDAERKISLVDLPYITTPANAQAAAARYLRAQSLPLRKASFKCNRAAFGFRMGAVFLLEAPEQGLDRGFFRVMTADYGTLEQGEMSVEAVEDVFSITGMSLVSSGGSGGQTTQLPSGGGQQLTISEYWTDDGVTGTLELGIDDPGNTVTKVEFATQQGSAAMSAWATASGPPWTASVSEVPKQPSYIYWRVTYTEQDGTSQQTEGVHVYGGQATPDTPQISGAFDASGNLTVQVRADALATTLRAAASTSAMPSDATVDATTGVAGPSATFTNILTAVPVGGVGYVAARSYAGTTPSGSTGTAAFTRGVGPTGTGLASAVGFEFGDGVSSPSVGALSAARVPFAYSITEADIWGDASGSAVVDVESSTDGITWASIAASDKPTLASQQSVQDTTLTGWTTTGAADTWLRGVLNSVSTCKQVSVELKLTRS